MKLFAVLAVLLVVALRAENWPQWRGPLGTGVSAETRLPTKWSESQNIAWKTPLRGLGVSAPIVWGDMVFVTSQVGAGAFRPGTHPTLVQGPEAATSGERPLGGARRQDEPGAKVAFVIAAYRRQDGRSLWEYQFAAEGDLPAVHEKRNLAASSPVTDGERVYSWFGNGQIVAVDTKGKPVWTRHLGRELATFDVDWGHASSPALFRDLLILPCYQGSFATLLALDTRTGKQVWRVNAEKGLKSHSTPLIIDRPQGPELIVNSTARVEAFEPATGKQLWQVTESNRFAIPMPVHHDGVIYTSRGYRSGPYAAIRAGGRGDVTKSHLLWRVATGAPYISSVVYYEGLLYMSSEVGIVTAIDPTTGEQVWRERLGGFYSASPVAADGKIYLLSETGEMLVLRAGRTPQVLARNKLDEQCIASPAISGRQILIRSAQHLIAIGAGQK